MPKWLCGRNGNTHHIVAIEPTSDGWKLNYNIKKNDKCYSKRHFKKRTLHQSGNVINIVPQKCTQMLLKYLCWGKNTKCCRPQPSTTKKGVQRIWQI